MSDNSSLLARTDRSDEEAGTAGPEAGAIGPMAPTAAGAAAPNSVQYTAAPALPQRLVFQPVVEEQTNMQLSILSMLFLLLAVAASAGLVRGRSRRIRALPP